MKNDLILRVKYEDTIYDLDVMEDIPLRVDMSTVEVGKLGRIFGIGSQQFTLPGTKKNNRFFKNAYDIGADNPPAMYNSIDCWVLQRGETLLQGQLELTEVITDEDGYVNYNVSVSDKVVQFKEALKGKFLRDGDFTPYNHIITSQSVLDSWNDELLSGSVFYPLGEFGRDDDNQGFSVYPPLGYIGGDLGSSSTPLNLRQFLPAIKLKDVLDIIFEQVGFRYTGSFTETDDFNNLYVFTKSDDEFGANVPSASAEFDAFTNATLNVSSSQTLYVTASTEITDPKDAYNTTTSEYTALTTGNHIFNATLTFDNSDLEYIGAKSSRVTVQLRKGSSKPGSVFATETRFFNDGDPSSLTVSVSGQTNMTGGSDKFFADVFFSTIYLGPETPVLKVTRSELSCTEAPPVYENEPIDMSLQFNSELKSEDVIQGIINQFNLVFIPDINDESTIIIEQFDDWLRSGQIKDWTRKYDTSKRVSIKHPISELPKSVIITNDEDNDRFSKIAKEQEPYRQYGSLELISTSNNAIGDDEVKTLFAPVILGSSFQTGSNYPNIDFSSTTAFPHLYKYDNDKVSAYAFKPRIGYKVTNSLPSGSNIFVGLAGTNTSTSGSYATLSNVSQLPAISGSTNDLHFNNAYGDFAAAGLNVNSGRTAFTEYWETYYQSLYWDDGRFVTLDLLFEPSEYQQIKLNDIILIKNQYYRINKIKGFNLTQDDVVTVELIKLYPEYFNLEELVTTTTTTTTTVAPCNSGITTHCFTGYAPLPDDVNDATQLAEAAAAACDDYPNYGMPTLRTGTFWGLSGTIYLNRDDVYNPVYAPEGFYAQSYTLVPGQPQIFSWKWVSGSFGDVVEDDLCGENPTPKTLPTSTRIYLDGFNYTPVQNRGKFNEIPPSSEPCSITDSGSVIGICYINGITSITSSACIGRTVYVDIMNETPLNGLKRDTAGDVNLWYGVSENEFQVEPRYYILVGPTIVDGSIQDNKGEILDWIDCNPPTTTTTTTTTTAAPTTTTTTTTTTTSTTTTTTTTTAAPTTTTTTTTIPGIAHEVDAAEDAGSATSGDACSTITTGDIYSNRANVASIIVGDILYSNDLLTNAWNGGNGSTGKWYGLSDTAGAAEYAMRIDIAGEVKEIVDCSVTTTTTTTVATTAFNDIGYDASTGSTACSNYPSGNVFYGDDATWLNVGTIYTNASGTNFAPPGFYSDGTYVHEVTNQGSVISTALC